jgi:hypothetical protein
MKTEKRLTRSFADLLYLGIRNGKTRLHLPAEEEKPQKGIWRERDVRTLRSVWRGALRRKHLSNDL